MNNKNDRDHMLVLTPILKLHLLESCSPDSQNWIEKFINHYSVFIDASYYGEKNIAEDLDRGYEFVITVNEIEEKFGLSIPQSFREMYPL